MNPELLHKPYRNQIRKIIITYPQIDGANPLFYLCIELINASHTSFITLKGLAKELVDSVAEYWQPKPSTGNHVKLASIKQATLNWLTDDDIHANIPFELLNALSSKQDTKYELSKQQTIAVQLERLKKATKEHQLLLDNIHQTNQALVSILDLYLIDRKKFIQDNKVKEYKNSYLPFFQQSYQQKEKTIEALKQAIEGNSVDLKKHLSTLRNGTLGKELKKFVKSGQANSLVDRKVNTVSEFIEALDKRINQPNNVANIYSNL